MKEKLIVRGRLVTPADIVFIRSFIEKYHDKRRTFISKELCRYWNWRQPNGALKDMACRDFLSRLISNNVRFLILPWVKVPHLASHLLSLIAKRISSDWQRVYGYPIVLLETFVEKQRFFGTCYKAANWLKVGETCGRGRNDRYKKKNKPIKAVFVYPLHKNFRLILNG